MITQKITTEEFFIATLSPLNKRGHPAPVDGKPTWTLEGDAVTTEVSEDGMSCKVIPTGNDGTSTIHISADADVGEGIETIEDSLDVVCSHPRASSLGLKVGTIQEIPEPAPEPTPEPTPAPEVTPEPTVS